MGAADAAARGSQRLLGQTRVLIAGLVLAKLAFHLLTNGLYGFHRDELYYLDSGFHPAAGYVDYPPITPLLARLEATLLPISPWTLRLLPAVAGAAIIVLAWRIARDLGGGRTAELLAATAAAAAPALIGANWLFQTVSFDQLWWVVTLAMLVRLRARDEPRWWLGIGASVGLGLETKLTILALGIGLVVGVLATPLRRQLRTPWPWLGLLLALAIATPHLAWQVQNGWPTLEYVRQHNAAIESAGQGLSINFDGGGVLAFIAFQPLIVGILTLPLWALGWYGLLRQPRWRPVGLAAGVAFALFVPVGKAYYPAPLVPVLLAAGCVELERLSLARRWRRSAATAGAAMAVQLVVLLPLTAPVVPQSSMAAWHLDVLRSDFAETVGWPELVAAVADAYQSLPPAERARAIILADNYGEAGAIDRFGPAFGLPAALSTELTYWYWKPPQVDAQTAIAIGIPARTLRQWFGEVTQVGTVPNVDGVHTSEAGGPILVCRQPRVPLDAVWPRARNFS